MIAVWAVGLMTISEEEPTRTRPSAVDPEGRIAAQKTQNFCKTKKRKIVQKSLLNCFSFTEILRQVLLTVLLVN